MERSQIVEIVRCLPRGRTVYRYFRDRYALQLLRDCVGAGRPVADIKRTRFARLLERQTVRSLLARTPDGVLDADRLECAWPPRPVAYRLTLGTWGDARRWDRSWDQTSRPGLNLVLQLNFSAGHERIYRQLLRPCGGHPFENAGHPISRRHHTLAWARLDIDLDAGEALIEEIQQDWIREFHWYESRLAKQTTEAARRRYFGRYFGDGSLSPLRLGYYAGVLAPHERLWDEAVLSAALWFLRHELGVRRIWYHTFEGGCALKGFGCRRPPRSLYTSLPRRFCFERTGEAPGFLYRHPNRIVRRRIRNREIEWYELEL